MDIVLATFSAVELVLSLGAAIIAFSLRKTFEGGIFEVAWRIIAVAPVVYAAGQAIKLLEAGTQPNSTMESLGSVVEVIFLVILVIGFFTFASAWRKRPSETAGGSYANKAKGALVFFMGRTGASAVLLYTGEPKAEDFEDRLGKVLGKGAGSIVQRTTEGNDSPDLDEKEKKRTQALALEGNLRSGRGAGFRNP